MHAIYNSLIIGELKYNKALWVIWIKRKDMRNL